MARKPAPPGADRRQLILEAALDVFAEQGFEGATSKEIAARAGVTHGLIYFYFTSKEELFQAAFEHTLRGALDQLRIPSEEDADTEPAVVIERGIASLLETVSSPRVSSLMRIMLRMAARDDQRAGPLGECKLSMTSAVQTFTDVISTYLDSQIARGRLRPVNTRATVMLALGGAIAALRTGLVCPASDEEERVRNAREWAHAFSEVLLQGLEPRTSPLEAASASDAATPLVSFTGQASP
jgi:AcrR family transcriptional regulator